MAGNRLTEIVYVNMQNTCISSDDKIIGLVVDLHLALCMV